MDTKTTETDMDRFLGIVEKALPLAFDRITAVKTLGGLLGKKTLANADAAGTGPAGRLKMGKKVFYERAAFMEWLKSQVQ